MSKSKVVLDYKIEHTNRDLDELLTSRGGAPGALKYGEAGQPGPTGLGGLVPSLAPVYSSTLIFTL
jgi:hypothetical protein